MWRALFAVVAAMCLMGASPAFAAVTHGTFTPATNGIAANGSGSASLTYSSDASGAGAIDAQASMTKLDPTATSASALAVVGGVTRFDGTFPPGDYVGATTLSQVDATATGTGTGWATADFQSSAYCDQCTGGSLGAVSIVSSTPTEGTLGTPSCVSDASFTVHFSFTLTSTQSSIEVSASTAGRVESGFGSGELHFTGTIRHVSVRRVNS
jgi:hypothetical protein